MTFNKIFSHIFKGTIWRLFPDTAQNLLTIETRNYDDRTVSFFSLDIVASHISHLTSHISEPWWIGIEDAYNGLVFFHHYNHIQFSNHIGIICFDVAAQKIRWERKELVFYKLTADAVIAIKQSKEHSDFVKLSLHSGEIIAEIPEINSLNEVLLNFVELRNTAIVHPSVFTEEDQNFGTVSQFTQKRLSVVAAHTIEYLEHGDYMFVSFYIFENGLYTNRLLVVTLAGDILLDEVLAKDQQGVGVRTYFVWGNKLIFIKSKNELIVYEL